MSENNHRLLIVDDEEDLIEILVDILEAKGYEVDSAYNGVEALELIQNNKNYSVLITDLNMPKMDGIELIEKTSKSFPFMVPVIITAYADTDAAVAALKAGAYDFISKPFRLETIYLTINRAIEKHIYLINEDSYQKELEKKVQDRTEELETINDQILNLYRLAQKTKETLKLDKKLEYFKDFCINTFRPDSFSFLIFCADTNVFTPQGIYSRKDEKPNPVYTIKEILPFEHLKFSKKLNIFSSDIETIAIKLERKSFFGAMYLGFTCERNFNPENKMFELFVSEIEGTLYNSHLMDEHKEEMKRMFLSSVRTHAYTIEAKDSYTKGHCERVEKFSEIIARKMIEDENRLFNLSVACILHDIGKIGVPESIIKKPGKLNDQEYALMKKHPEIGAEIVKHMYGMNLAPIVKYHHEWYNGKGYPEGLKGNNIPLEARIMAVADTYDAMTSSRPYRDGLDPQYALEELQRYSNIQFDPDVVRVFTDCFEDIKTADTSLTGVEINF